MLGYPLHDQGGGNLKESGITEESISEAYLLLPLTSHRHSSSQERVQLKVGAGGSSAEPQVAALGCFPFLLWSVHRLVTTDLGSLPCFVHFYSTMVTGWSLTSPMAGAVVQAS